MVLAGLPTTALRIIASDAGRVGEKLIFNRQFFPANLFGQACVTRLDRRKEAQCAEAPDSNLIYEVLRVKRGCPLFGPEHVARLGSSLRLSDDITRLHDAVAPRECLPDPVGLGDDYATSLKLAAEYCCGSASVDGLLRDVNESLREIAAAHPELEENIKIFVFLTPRDHQQPVLSPAADEAAPSSTMSASARTGGVRWCFSYCMYFIKAFYPPPEMYAKGTTLRILRDAQRDLPNAKVIQATLRERAIDEQTRTGCFEVLLCHKDGLVPEGSRSNYFLISRQGEVVMSRDEDVLLGITRLAIEDCCRAAGIPVVKRALYEKDVMDAEAVAMTGTSVGVLPVARIDDKEFSSADNATLQRVHALYEERARAALNV
jgi:branched-subunit amino acid aminotransferase/4-amino-4-deoxychorismate lyase